MLSLCPLHIFSMYRGFTTLARASALASASAPAPPLAYLVVGALRSTTGGIFAFPCGLRGGSLRSARLSECSSRFGCSDSAFRWRGLCVRNAVPCVPYSVSESAPLLAIGPFSAKRRER